MKISSDTYYHIYNRGNNRGPIFFESENYTYFLYLFKNHVAPHCEVHAYCLMPNHFHFFIRVNDKLPFEKGIKNFFIAYAKAINKRYNRVGSLFQGRYKASEITSDGYYTTIITYIHQNPVVAKLVKNLKDYRFSSYASYLSDKPTMIKKQEVLDWFGGLDGFIIHHQQVLNETQKRKLLGL
ncbi:hypothetical protein BH09BAC6_BH09BAC6_08020 [soil metagenome]